MADAPLKDEGGLTAFDPSPVQFINQEVYSYAAKDATANAHQAVAQAMAQAIQNANTTLLNMEALAQAAQAVFMKRAAESSAAEASAWLALAAETLVPLEAMNKFMGEVGKTADEIVSNFPLEQGVSGRSRQGTIIMRENTSRNLP